MRKTMDKKYDSKRILDSCKILAGICLIATIVFWPYAISTHNWLAMLVWLMPALFSIVTGYMEEEDHSTFPLLVIICLLLGPGTLIVEIWTLQEKLYKSIAKEESENE